jgi:diaminohydroxyphosphoribosylaminopyrimidine deaminase/5-amino-6-(5-phosphoribosylamino)uracil reductase
VKINEKYLKRALLIAENGRIAAMPNPSVGAVIVYDNQIIGEGYTSAYGGNHAEVNAINSVKNKSLLKKATIFVSLEPCSHFGKTPPCCDLIIKHQIPNVVIGILDPNEKVAGNGIKKLIEAGKNVTVGVLEAECLAANKRFFTFHKKKRPYIILKWAESQDGFIAPAFKEKSEPFWITNTFSQQLSHKWRSEEQAILVGTKTVIADNPSLTTRNWFGNNPIRIVIDKYNRIPKESNIFDNQAKTFVLNLEFISFDKYLAQQIAQFLFQAEIQSVIIEGGTQTLQTFIDEKIWDEARIFKGNLLIKKGIKAPIFEGNLESKINILDDQLIIYSHNDKHNYF